MNQLELLNVAKQRYIVSNVRLHWIEQSLTPHPIQYRSFRRRSSQPIT